VYDYLGRLVSERDVHGGLPVGNEATVVRSGADAAASGGEDAPCSVR
jgi:hypothetical protein